MTNTVGRVNFRAVLDGTSTPKDAERLGQEIGRKGSKGFDEEWTKRFRETLSKSGQQSFDAWQKAGAKDGGAYGSIFQKRLKTYITQTVTQANDIFAGIRLDDGFIDDFAKRFKDADEATAELHKNLKALDGTVNSWALKSAAKQVDEWADAQRRAAEDTERQRKAMDDLNVSLREQSNAYAIGQAGIRQRRIELDGLSAAMQRMVDNSPEIDRQGDLFERLGARIDRASTSAAKMNFQWSDLSHNTRQWTLIIGAVLAGMQDIAVLGSAAGAGLIAVGGAATSAVAGVGGLAAVFVTLSKETEELPPHLQRVDREFENLKGSFSGLREAIATGAFREMDGVFDGLARNVRTLAPQFEVLGTSIGKVFSDLERNTRPGTEALEQIRRSIALAGPNFQSLASSAGSFGVSFLRAFNGMQPLVEDLLGYLDLLAKRFDSFTRGGGLNQWMRNAQTTFASLGPLIDATARALNDLVTPESARRTAAFIDDLTGFMPNLSKFLDILGRVDVFGLLAQALNDMGRALAPLAPAFADLADAVAGTLSASLTGIAETLTVVSAVIAPVVQGLANFVSALPTPWVEQAASALAVLATGFVALRVGGAVSSAITAISGLTERLTAMGPAGAAASKGLSALSKAGVVGVAVGTVVALSSALNDLNRDMSKIEARARSLVASNASISQSYNDLGRSAFGVLPELTNVSEALDMLDKVGPQIERGFATIDATFSDVGRQASSLSVVFTEMDKPLAALAQKNLPAAQKQFAAYTEELGANEQQIAKILTLMPEYAAAVENGATSQTGLATSAEVAAAAVTAVGGSAEETQAAIESMADRIRTFNEEFLNTRSAARDYEAAIDDLTASMEVNGLTLDITTAKGRENEEALDNLAQSTKDYAAELRLAGEDQATVNGAISSGREQLINILAQFGITGQAAQDYANKLGLIPEKINTRIDLDQAAAQRGVDTFISSNTGRRITVWIDPKSAGVVAPGMNMYASGTITTGPEVAVIGEAGPEAVVPLNRDLSRVDPSVRWLSAIAQGKTPAMAGGGIAGVSGGVNIEAGAIVVQEAGNAEYTANDVIERIIERVAG